MGFLSLTHYAFEKVICIVGGAPVVGFFEGDDVITVARNVPDFSMQMGAGGDGLAVQAADQSGTITLKLLQTSPSNAALGLVLEQNKRGVFIPLPFVLKDAGTNVQLVTAAQCVIVKPADQIYGANGTVREWQLIAEKLIAI